MLCHEFGIMGQAPRSGERFDSYEPGRYGCIRVPDDDLQPLLEAFRLGRTYWHTLDRPELGLAYYGVSLIPPETCAAYLEIVLKRPQLSALAALFLQAARERRFVIHFGI